MPICYSRTDVTSVAIPETGHLHAKEDGFASDDGKRMAVDCHRCEPHLLAGGWKHNAGLVELTPDETKAAEDAATSTLPMMQEMARAIADVARQQALAGRAG